MIQTIKKTANILSTLAVILALTLVLLLVAPRVFGVHVFTVLSGSMEPAYPVGSMIYVKSVDPFQLKAGDVISFLRVCDSLPDERRCQRCGGRQSGALQERGGNAHIHHSEAGLFRGLYPASARHVHRCFCSSHCASDSAAAGSSFS